MLPNSTPVRLICRSHPFETIFMRALSQTQLRRTTLIPLCSNLVKLEQNLFDVRSQRRRRRATSHGELKELQNLLFRDRGFVNIVVGATDKHIRIEQLGNAMAENRVAQEIRQVEVLLGRCRVLVDGLFAGDQLKEDHPEAVDVSELRSLFHLDELRGFVALRG